MSDKLLLRTALGKHAHVKPLTDGRVSSSRVTFAFRDYDPLPKAFRTMKVDDVGKAVGVEQVLFVDLVGADIASSNGGQLIKGTLAGYVRIVDVPTGKTLWPPNLNDGYPIQIETPYTDGNEANVETIREQLARSMGDTVAKLFYTYSLE